MEEIEKTENQAAAPLLERAFIFLEDGDWQRADEYCEKVLDLDPKCAGAYLGKLLAELRVHSKEQLPSAGRDFSGSNNYAKAVRFGCTELEELNKRAFYNACVNNMNNSKTVEQFEQVRDMFLKLDGFMDSAEKAKECGEKARETTERIEQARKQDIYNKAEYCAQQNTVESLREASEIFESISGFRDAEQKSRFCLESSEEKRKLDIYNNAEHFFWLQTTESLEEALKLYESIPGYRNADHQTERCRSMLNRKQKKGRRLTKILIITGVLCAVLCASGIFVYSSYIKPYYRYNDAKEYYERGEYREAAQKFEALSDYKDSKEMAADSLYRYVYEEYKQGRQSWFNYKMLSNSVEEGVYLVAREDKYNNVLEKVLQSRYDEALSLCDAGNYEEAEPILYALAIFWFKDANEKYECCYYKKKLASVKTGDYIEFRNYSWTVVATEEDRVLLTSTVYYLPYKGGEETVEWNKSSLREYLNNNYYDTFSSAEKQMMVKGVDNVFILSDHDIESYNIDGYYYNLKRDSDHFPVIDLNEPYPYKKKNDEDDEDEEYDEYNKYEYSVKAAIWVSKK